MRLPSQLVLPRYGGGSLVDVPATAVRILTGEDAGPGLAKDVLPPEATRDVERVIVLVLDGLGAEQLDRLEEAGAAPNLASLKRAELTSVAPSTTVAALASLATGLPPVTHGILGYRMHLPQFGITANMIKLRGTIGGSLEDAGLTLEDLFPFRTIFERFRDAGVATAAVTKEAFLGSALTRMIYRGVEPRGNTHVGDLFVRGRENLEATRGRRAYLRLYWDGIDTISHQYGPFSAEHEAEGASIDAALGRELLDRVDDPGTLLLVTADHGHVEVPKPRVVHVQDHPDLLDHLVFPPTGEGRFAYLHCRPGRVEDARRYVTKTWPDDAIVVDTAEARDAGLFGKGPVHPEFDRRAGELLMIATSDARFVTDYGPRRPHGNVGNHGGLASAEMRVPLLWRRLG